MKKILIPTDFSPGADNALNYAIEIAAKFESKLLVYHVYTFYRKIDFDWNFPEDAQPYVKNIEKQMKFTKWKFMDKINEKGLAVQTIVEEDIIFSLFGRIVEKHNVSLIVMGSKGASGFGKVLFGSVAVTALKIAKVPVLIVPPNHTFAPPKQIIFATDFNEVSTSILSPLKKLALEFGAKVTILYIQTGFNIETHQKKEMFIEGVDTTYYELPKSKNINETINDFVKNNNFDLICMIRREKGFFERMFKKSITKTQAYNNIIPLLVLPENRTITNYNT